MAVTSREIISNILGFIGAVAGGVLGYYTFRWIRYYNLYGMMIPGALLGLGCGLLSQCSSHWRGLACAAAGLGLGLFTEWRFFPFIADDSLDYFLKHVLGVNIVHLLMIAARGFFAYWLGKDAGLRFLRGIQRRDPAREKLDSPTSV